MHVLRERCEVAHNHSWEDKINHILQSSNNPKVFWNKIKLLTGNSTEHTNYLENKNGRKYHTDQQKCSIMEKTWKGIFRITEEEEYTFDIQHSEHIESYIRTHQRRIKPHNTTDFSRLHNSNFYTREITTEEIKKHLSRSKNKAPGSSKINKIVLEKCPEKALVSLTNIHNACLSIGHFPSFYQKRN